MDCNRFLNGRINRIKLHFASLVLDKRQNRLCGFSSSRLEATNQDNSIPEARLTSVSN
jgi:hypothetical protein